MGFDWYLPRSHGFTTSKRPAIRFGKNFLSLNSQAMSMLSDKPLEYIRIGFDADSGAIKVMASDQPGMPIKKTKTFIKGFLRRYGIEWLAGMIVYMDQADGGIIGTPEPPDEDENGEEENENDGEEENDGEPEEAPFEVTGHTHRQAV